MKLNKYQVELPCENGVRQQLDQLKVLDQLKICVFFKNKYNFISYRNIGKINFLPLNSQSFQ